ncbi:hypothetical protein NEUTE2DRAFT_71815, partial [Neurospora tetrasperma FGSC 2509]
LSIGGVFDRGLDDLAKNAAAVFRTVFNAFATAVSRTVFITAIEYTVLLIPNPTK